MKNPMTAKQIARLRLWITRVLLLGFLVEYIGWEHNPVAPTDANGWMFYVGAIVIVVGALLRSWAAGVLHKNKVLTMIGPYSLVRHPLYVGSLLIAVGFGFLLNSLWWWVMSALILILVYIPTIIKEQRTMRERYTKEWDAFTRRVWYLFPLKLDPADTIAPWSIKQWAKNTEYNALFTSLLGIVVLLVWAMM